MTGLYLGSAEVAGVRVGTVAAQAVYVGDAKVWPTATPFARQRMVKSGDATISYGTTSPVPGWVSDGTYPGVVDADRLRVTGAGTATITAQVTGSLAGGNMTVTLQRNGVQIGSSLSFDFTGATRTITVPGVTVTDGDLLSLAATNPTFSTGTINDGTTWIDVNPT